MSSSAKLESVKAKLTSLLLDLSGFDLDELDQSATFLELGFDSLFLIQFSQSIKKGFKVKVSFRQLIEQIPTPTALIQFLAEKATDDVLPAAPSAEPNPTLVSSKEPAPVNGQSIPRMPLPQATPIQPLQNGTVFNPMPSGATGSVEELKHLMAQQLQVMSLQLSMLTGSGPAPTVMPSGPSVTQSETESLQDASSSPSGLMVIAPKEETLKEVPKPARRRFGPYKPILKAADGGLTEKQQAHLDEFIARYTEKTQKSKELAARHRPHFADPRGIYGFRKIWKEMVYQINTVKSKGSKPLGCRRQ